MNKHEKFLEFNGKNIVFLRVDGTYWIALKPILEALGLESSRYLKRTKRDSFFSTCVDTVSMQVEKKGRIQGRKMTCLPEKFIYGWICFLNADNEELNNYKRTCYELLYNHFHGTIISRKELLLERNKIDDEIFITRKALKEEDNKYQELENLLKKRKALSNQLNTIDKELVKQPELFSN